MPMIVDRRLDGRNKSAVNRQRLMRRYKQQIKKAVHDAVSGRSITDTSNGEQINIPSQDVSEPVIHHGSGGMREQVHPGNKEFHRGDRISRPEGGGGGAGAGEASDSGEGEDDFSFQISKDEYMEVLFEELELPNLVKTKVLRQAAKKPVRAGFSNTGVPNNLNLVRTMRRAKGRRLAIVRPYKKQLLALQEELLTEQGKTPGDQDKLDELLLQIEKLKSRIGAIPFIDTHDLKFNQFVQQPKPVTQAVMFCIMDVSGSMTEDVKDIAKRFFFLLYLFLSRSYEKTEVVFIRHHTSAKEVDEQEFFYSRETGGTIVSSALQMTADIIQERFPTDDWNIYVAQASDGDNWGDDCSRCTTLLREDLLPYLQYYAYVEIHDRSHQRLWDEYLGVAESFKTFAMRHIKNAAEIFPVFHDLFKKQAA